MNIFGFYLKYKYNIGTHITDIKLCYSIGVHYNVVCNGVIVNYQTLISILLQYWYKHC